jgi:hypothetical protein
VIVSSASSLAFADHIEARRARVLSRSLTSCGCAAQALGAALGLLLLLAASALVILFADPEGRTR